MSRVVLITGGARGIGLACARAFLGNGDRVAITYRGTQPPDDIAGDILAIKCDVTDSSQVDAAFTEIEEKLGPVEVLVSNAGITADMLVLRMGDEDFDRVIETNLTGGFHVAKRAVTKMMRARWGRVIFIGSIVGSLGQAGQANYAASKAGLIGLTRSLAREFASRNITANVIAPGAIETEMLESVGAERKELLTDTIPMGRLGDAGEIAATVRFLASDDAAYITGAVIPVDGGLGMGGW